MNEGFAYIYLLCLRYAVGYRNENEYFLGGLYEHAGELCAAQRAAVVVGEYRLPLLLDTIHAECVGASLQLTMFFLVETIKAHCAGGVWCRRVGETGHRLHRQWQPRWALPHPTDSRNEAAALHNDSAGHLVLINQ